ncbi:MAG TPA: transcription antitermination factor NusB [Bacteroidota bacterium]|nr:transcription antitermination factor NusB [Bacteroidota bacterium]
MKEHQQVYKRRIIRERVMQALYAFELSKDPIAHIMENIFAEIREHDDEYTFAEKLLKTTIEHQATIDGIIKKKASNWNFDRIALIDKLLLRMGICELFYCEDIPPKVTINETIEIAKHFSTEKSGQFINGILDSILHDMKADGTLEKRGRGLVDSSEGRQKASAKKKVGNDT